MRKIERKRFLVFCGLMLLMVMGTFSLVKSFFADTERGGIPRGEYILLNEILQKQEKPGGTETYTEYTCRIPEISGDSLTLCMDGFWSSFQVFLDQDEIYFYRDDYQELGVRKHWIFLGDEAVGKVLSIRFFSNGSVTFETLKVPVYLGEKYAVLFHFLSQEGYALIFFCFSLMLGISTVLVGYLLNRKTGKDLFYGFIYLGLFDIDAGIWVLTDSSILQLFTGRTGLIVLVSFLSFLLLPLLLLLFLREITTRGKRPLELLCGLCLLTEGLFMLGYLLRPFPIYYLLILAHALILVSLIVILHRIWVEVRENGSLVMKRMLMGIEVLAFFVVLSLFSFWANPAGRYAILYCMGIFLFSLCMVYAYMGVAYRRVEEDTRIAMYQHMAYTDVMTGFENRTAFEIELKTKNFTGELAYLVFDSNNLKKINDTYGHQEGDKVIIGTAECLEEVFGSTGRCFRIGGDEFVVIVRDFPEKEITKKLEALKKVIAEKNEKRRIPIELACGYAFEEGTAAVPEKLFKEADARMYENKRRTKAL